MNITLKEKVYGALFGYAAGDALGIGTEFMTRAEIHRKYPDGLTRYSQIIRDAHRSQCRRGDYSNDTRQVEILMKAIILENKLSYKSFARDMREFYLQDPIDLTANMRWVLSQEDFVKDPFATAIKVWTGMKVDEAPSDAIGRAMVCGMWNKDVLKNADETCRVTHPHSRCRVSAQIIAHMTNSLMWKDQEATFDELLKIATENEPEVIRYLEIARYGALADFNLDHENSYWYVRKAMGAALWTLWHCDNPNEALLKIVNEGGDSDGNAALATGILGIKYGFSAIDKCYIDGLQEKEGLAEIAEKFTNCLERNFC